jgi:hypothetical protein
MLENKISISSNTYFKTPKGLTESLKIGDPDFKVLTV